ncbi:UbiA family prenyltransferase [Marivita sp. S2033]|uniref:UbiA family prenyltransferase n=1 Tax=Marivita sp. S2033 TaxID=3373187 RepID=UPI003981A6E1
MNVMPRIVSKPSPDPLLDLYVDLDGTLIATDIAEESLVHAARDRTAIGSALKAYRAGGLAGLKRSLALSNPPDVAHLPYRHEVLDYIRNERSKGRRVILATAADATVAHAVAAHLKLFDAVIASEPGRNLKGAEKLRAINELSKGPFEYLGDSAADIPIWQSAARSGFVAPQRAARQEMRRDPDAHSLIVQRKISPLQALFTAMRPHQWAKNILVFVPILFAHEYVHLPVMLAGVLAFLCFSLCASGVYLINDIMDIQADRQHASKYKRPFAAGDLTIRQGIPAAVVLLVASVSAGFFFINALFGFVLIGYAILTTAYTFVLKQYSTVDVVALSLLHTVRILAGSAATGLTPSPWLLTYSLFFFLSLAYMKRFIELDRMAGATDNARLPSRNYFASEVQLVLTFGIANGALSVLTLAQYVNSTAVHANYNSPFLLWFIIPIMMFWTYRSWTWASRGQIGDDPVVFALKDTISRLCVGLVLVIIVSARLIDIVWSAG